MEVVYPQPNSQDGGMNLNTPNAVKNPGEGLKIYMCDLKKMFLIGRCLIDITSFSLEENILELKPKIVRAF